LLNNKFDSVILKALVTLVAGAFYLKDNRTVIVYKSLENMDVLNLYKK